MAYYYPAPYYYGYPPQPPYPAPSPVTIHTAPTPPPFYAPPAPSPSHPVHQPAFPPRHYQPSFVAPPSGYHPTAEPSLDEEEAAALAHLQAIQRRRQELEASQARGAASVARAKAQKEADIRAQINKELAKQQALRARYEEEELKKRLYKEAVQVQRENMRALRAAERQKAIQYQSSLRSHAPSPATRGDDISNVLGSLFGVDVAQEETVPKVRFASAARAYPSPGQAYGQKSHQPESEHDVVSLTDLLRSIGLVEDSVSTPACSQQCSTKSQAPASSTPSAAAGSTQSQSAPQGALPAEVNDILHKYLGLYIDPVASQGSADSSVEKAKGNGVPEGLNELLSQFGLVFETEPETEAKPKASHSTQPGDAVEIPPSKADSAPASDAANQPEPTAPAVPASQPKPATPFTSLLGEFTNVHPAIANFLKNVEVVVTDEVKERTRGAKAGCSGSCDQQCADKCQKASAQDKGKGVAEGEKKPAARVPKETESEPTVNPTTSLSTLDDIQHRFESLRASFTFPEHLSFAKTSPGSHAPPLLFDRNNSAYHAQVNALLQLLLQTDSINSGGEKAVRQKRKEVVKKVEDELERLERLRDDLWEDVKEKRERGEEGELDAGNEKSWSDTASVRSEETHSEETPVEETHPEEKATVEDEQTGASGEAQGYEVLNEQPEDSTPTEAPQQPQSPSYADAAKHAVEHDSSTQESPSEPPIAESTAKPSAIQHQNAEVPPAEADSSAQQEVPSSPQQLDNSSLPPAPHHPVTVEDAEDENENKKEMGDKRAKRQAKRAGSDSEDYEML
ncbi:hypothetical protein IAR50_005915 [Cryptococcus sp. DSM 104548]